MKKQIFTFLTLLLLLTGCKKAIREKQEDLVIIAMTSGQWKVMNFRLNGTDITDDFSAYRFKYYSNYSVDAIKNGTVEKTGTWQGSSTTMIISASFSNPAYPLNLINGEWLVTSNGWTFVEATQTSGSDVKSLRLEKE